MYCNLKREALCSSSEHYLSIKHVVVFFPKIYINVPNKHIQSVCAAAQLMLHTHAVILLSSPAASSLTS